MGTTLKQIAQNVAQKEVIINEINQALSPAGRFGRRNNGVGGLTFNYYGGRYADKNGVAIDIQDGSILLTASSTNYIEFNLDTKTMLVNTSSFTDDNIPVAICNASDNSYTYFDARIDALIPTGVSPSFESSGGGGGGSTYNSYAMFDLVGSNLESLSNFDGVIKGGNYPKTSKTISDDNYYSIDDTPMGIYPYGDTYFVLEIDQSGAKISQYQSGDAYNKNSIRRLLYIVKRNAEDSTKVSINDVRSLNLYINRKTVIRKVPYTSGAKSQTLDFSFLKNLQDTSYGFFAESMSNFPPIFSINVSLRCISEEKGFAVGDETEMKSGNMLETALGCAYQYVYATGNVIVSQGSMTYVWNRQNQAYETITSGYWEIIVRIKIDI